MLPPLAQLGERQHEVSRHHQAGAGVGIVE
jgi:hypothetical protein